MLFGIPIALAHVALRASFPDEHDWGELAYYLSFFIVGYVLVSDARFLAAVRRDLVPGLVVGVSASRSSWRWTRSHGTVRSRSFLYEVVLRGIRAAQLPGWAWAVAAISVAMRVARFQRPLPEASADAAMPFFLLHQPVILALAYFVVAWNVGVPLKLLALLVTSFTVTAAAAWALSRPAITRTMLGVKARRAMGPAESGSFVRYPDHGRGLR